MKLTTLTDLNQLKKNGQKFAGITAYDANFAQLFYAQGIKVILVDDSLGMAIQGLNSTIPVNIDEITYHTRCVRNGAPQAFLIADLPFMSYATAEQSFASAAAVMRAGANMIKLEGGAWLCDTIKALTERSVPVCGHLGLTPQSVNLTGNSNVQCCDEISAMQLVKDAIALEHAGIQMLVLECIPTELAKQVSEELLIPVIGIGAGNHTDGQILQMHDLLGATEKPPSFVKDFVTQAGNIHDAIKCYREEVENGLYPAEEHAYHYL